MIEFSHAELMSMLSDPVVPRPPPEHRLYYDESGNPLHYSMENLPGNYVVIDAEEFAKCRFDVRVIKNKIIPLSDLVNKPPLLVRSVEHKRGTPTHPDDMTLIDYNSKIFWAIEDVL